MSAEPILSVRGLKKNFEGKQILKDMTFDVYAGEILVLLGGSGSGKSVTLRSLIGLEHPDEGEILYKNLDITKLTENQLFEVRKEISYVFQNGALFDSMTVEENLSYPLLEHTSLNETEVCQKVHDMLQLISLEGSEKLLPANLSGGMQKRVGLARSIILGPEIILYDEPTAGLDPSNTKRLLQLMSTLRRKGATGVFVTHDIPAAFEVGDRIAILHDKRIYTVGTVKEIENSSDPVVTEFISNTKGKSQWAAE